MNFTLIFLKLKFPHHILLDVAKTYVLYTNQYWIHRYLNNFHSSIFLSNKNYLHNHFFLNKESLFLNKLLNNQKKFTIKYKLSNGFTKKTSRTESLKFSEQAITQVLKTFKIKTSNAPLFKSNQLWNLFDIHFLKKEKMYTKLKYSRVPQYDIVSGGVAAIFAGFLGFLICEKFGFELVDSGDFYFLFIYLVFISIFARLFLKIINSVDNSWNIFSIKWFFSFIESLFFLLIKKIKTIYNLFI